jgi:alkylation response protein AidB-like acyl-CoA dehydrogenase
MPAERLLPTTEAEDLLKLTREIAREELAPLAARYEEEARFPREQFRLLGRSGLLGLPYPERWGGGAVPYEVYLQVLEEIATAWMTMGVGLSVHTMSCYALAEYGTEEQRERWLGDLLGGELLGAYALSEPHAGSDAAATLSSSTAPRPGSPTAARRTSTPRWCARRRTARGGSAACWSTPRRPACPRRRPNARWG